MPTPTTITVQTTPVGLVKKTNKFSALTSQKIVQSQSRTDPWERTSTILSIQPGQIFVIAQAPDFAEVKPPRVAPLFGSDDLAPGHPLADGIRRHAANPGSIQGGPEFGGHVSLT